MRYEGKREWYEEREKGCETIARQKWRRGKRNRQSEGEKERVKNVMKRERRSEKKKEMRNIRRR